MADGWLTTHVLDTGRGVPAAGIRIVLSRLTDGGAVQVAEAVTNADGRTATPLLKGADFQVGRYELMFFAGEYLRANGQVSGAVLFLDEVPIRFGISDEASHYHVPLLVSPWSYSTYRGS